jgi:hypothetical protein
MGGKDWIHLAQDRAQWLALENTLMSIRIPYVVGRFLRSWAASFLSRSTRLRGSSSSSVWSKLVSLFLRPGREADHSPPSKIGIKNGGAVPHHGVVHNQLSTRTTYRIFIYLLPAAYSSLVHCVKAALVHYTLQANMAVVRGGISIVQLYHCSVHTVVNARRIETIP